jgi:lipoprotein NlpD
VTIFSALKTGHLSLLAPLLIAVGIAGCSAPANPPKVRIASGPPLAWGGDAPERINKSVSNTYIVHSGDTLWAIAAVHGIELENLANWNKVDNTDQLRVGQQLRLTSPRKIILKPSKKPAVIKKPQVTQGVILEPKPKVKPVKVKKAKKVEKKPKIRTASKKTKFRTWKLPKYKPKKWLWPHKGRVLNRFGRRGQHRNNGIDIKVRVGDPVRASADGIVAYADSGLPGYGKMILLRHGGSYMTAYGYVNQILVRRGQPIKAGERIALAGKSGRATSPRLHFEIRHRVKPLNPMKHLSLK